MSDQSKLGLGQIITTEQNRDAIHVAVAPVVAGEPIIPGEHLTLLPNGEAVTSNGIDPTIGIADPFLRGKIKTGERFWLYLYPGSITSLRHEWTHPAFEPGRISHTDHIAKSKQWIDEEAARLDLTTNALLSHAERWLDEDDHTVQQGSEHWRDSFRAEEFWHHWEIVNGKTVPEEKRRSFYCCSC